MADDGNAAALFDLDGVLVSTDRFHYQAWKGLADEQGIHFDHEINNRLRGVSRMQSLEIILERADRQYSAAEKQAMCDRKNETFRELIGTLTPDDWLPGAEALLHSLQQAGARLALCSSSRNAPTILRRLSGEVFFETVVSGRDITRTKPDPQIFLLAAERLAVEPGRCVVLEDAAAGVVAARNAGMRCVGVGDPGRLGEADMVISDLTELSAADVVSLAGYC